MMTPLLGSVAAGRGRWLVGAPMSLKRKRYSPCGSTRSSTGECRGSARRTRKCGLPCRREGNRGLVGDIVTIESGGTFSETSSEADSHPDDQISNFSIYRSG